MLIFNDDDKQSLNISNKRDKAVLIPSESSLLQYEAGGSAEPQAVSVSYTLKNFTVPLVSFLFSVFFISSFFFLFFF